jgi:hypothetical protein
MELCKFCQDITVNLQAALPPPGEGRKRYKHQPDLANMIQAAGLGYELCQFFLKCAEGLSQDQFEEVQKGGQLYFCDLKVGTMSIQPSRGLLCYFDCVAPDLSSHIL